MASKRRTAMKSIYELSGNIKLRLPRSLHGKLLKRANFENVSLNQLCLMYLSEGVSSGNNLGTIEFNKRLEKIALSSKGDVDLFKKLDELNMELERLIPNLIYDLKKAISENKRNMNEYIEILQCIYPIYSSNNLEEKLPLLKLPSAKIVIKPNNDIGTYFEKIKNTAIEECTDAYVVYGDYDDYISIDNKELNASYARTISVYICCKYRQLREKFNRVKRALFYLYSDESVEIYIKPCYLQISIKTLIEQGQCTDNYINYKEVNNELE